MKLFPWRIKAKCIDAYKAEKGMYNSKSYWILYYFSFSDYSISLSSFASLLDIHIEITSSATGLKICAITAVIKMHRSVI